MTEELGDKPQQSLTPLENAAIIRALLDAEIKEKELARRVVGMQLATTLVATSAAYFVGKSPQIAMAVLSGGGVAVLNGMLVAWRMSRSSNQTSHDAHLQLRLMYFYAAERFLAVVALMAICMAVLKLYPLAVLGGFVLGQAVLLSARLLLRFKN